MDLLRHYNSGPFWSSFPPKTFVLRREKITTSVSCMALDVAIVHDSNKYCNLVRDASNPPETSSRQSAKLNFGISRTSRSTDSKGQTSRKMISTFFSFKARSRPVSARISKKCVGIVWETIEQRNRYTRDSSAGKKYPAWEIFKDTTKMIVRGDSVK